MFSTGWCWAYSDWSTGQFQVATVSAHLCRSPWCGSDVAWWGTRTIQEVQPVYTYLVKGPSGPHCCPQGWRAYLSQGIQCQDFDHLLSASQQREPHVFKNLPHERAQVRQALKGKKTSKANNAISSGDEEEVEKNRSRHHSKTTTCRILTVQGGVIWSCAWPCGLR